MKRLLLIVPALALAGCTSIPVESAPAASGPVLESTTYAPPIEPSVIEPYVPVDVVDEVMRSVAADEGITLPRGMGSEYADIICTAFDDGLSFPLVVMIAAGELDQWTPEQHAFLVGASVGASCPEWAGVVGGAV